MVLLWPFFYLACLYNIHPKRKTIGGDYVLFITEKLAETCVNWDGKKLWQKCVYHKMYIYSVPK